MKLLKAAEQHYTEAKSKLNGMKKKRNDIDQDYPETPASEYLYNRAGPWPQPSPGHPFGVCSAVIHLPWQEQLLWTKEVGLRYARNMLFDWPDALRVAFQTKLEEVSDAECAKFFEESLFAKMLNPKLDEPDKKTFAEFMKKEKGQYFKVDLAPVKFVQTYKGIYVSPSVALFHRPHKNAPIEIVAIHVNEKIFTNKDGKSWELAKHYLLEGASIVGTLLTHPLLHFPFDSINAVTKTALPKNHILFKLLIPHCKFTLPLENAVLQGESSILKNWKWQIYGCYPGPSEGLYDQFMAGYRGLVDNSSYPEYEFPLEPPKIYSKYGDFLQAYYDVIHNFVKNVMSYLPEDDIYVEQWTNYVCQFTPGIPSGEELIRTGKVTNLIAMFIWDVSVAHSLDHESFGSLPLNKVSMRLRVPPPTGDEKEDGAGPLIKPVDTFKFEMAMKMFYRPTNVTFLKDVNYNFADNRLIALNNQFQEDLRRVDQQVEGYRYIDLDCIAASVQY
ncbi:MAG: hypothetical protein OXT67_04725 [Zetaproteobacteria bacterium]|nr:hypothetical protein [Zetaproteobacteria bacterium]